MRHLSQEYLREKYRNEPVFNQSVKAIKNMMASGGMTISEVREALFMAVYTYELENPHTAIRETCERMKSLIGAGLL